MTRPADHLKLSPEASFWHDVLRCFLVLQVVLGHAVWISLPNLSMLLAQKDYLLAAIAFATRFGPQAAVLFIFLSGFFVGGALLAGAAKGEVMPAGPFFMRRCRRIVPVALLALALTALIDAVAQHLPGYAQVYSRANFISFSENYTLLTFIGNVFFLQPTFVPSFGSNGPLWTLGYIVQFYIAGYGLIRLMAWRRIAGGIGLIVLLGGFGFVYPDWSLLFSLWLIGAWARNARLPRMDLWPAVLAALLLLLTANFTSVYLHLDIAYKVLCAPIGILAICAIRRATALPGGRRQELIKQASDETYTVYAVHFPMITFVLAALFPPPPLATGGAFLLYVAIGLSATLGAVALVSLCSRGLLTLDRSS